MVWAADDCLVNPWNLVSRDLRRVVRTCCGVMLPAMYFILYHFHSSGPAAHSHALGETVGDLGYAIDVRKVLLSPQVWSERPFAERNEYGLMGQAIRGIESLYDKVCCV